MSYFCTILFLLPIEQDRDIFNEILRTFFIFCSQDVQLVKML